jgi:hypothetical protein
MPSANNLSQELESGGVITITYPVSGIRSVLRPPSRFFSLSTVVAQLTEIIWLRYGIDYI